MTIHARNLLRKNNQIETDGTEGQTLDWRRGMRQAQSSKLVHTLAQAIEIDRSTHFTHEAWTVLEH